MTKPPKPSWGQINGAEMRPFTEVLEELDELLGRPAGWIVNELFVGTLVDITVEREIDQPIRYYRNGEEELDYEGTGCFEDVRIAGRIVSVDKNLDVFRVQPPAGSEEWVYFTELEADTTVAMIALPN
jgi:hypothetical protein